MSIRVLELSKNSESVELSIDMQEGVGGGGYNGNLYQAGLEAYAGGGANIGYPGGDNIKINRRSVENLNTLSPYGQYFNQNYLSTTFSVKGDTATLVDSVSSVGRNGEADLPI
jgi:hypothetical protein